MKAKKTRQEEMFVTIATNAVCDFLREEKKSLMHTLNEGRISRFTDYTYAVVDIWSGLNKRPDLYNFTKEWIAKDYATLVGLSNTIKVLVGVPNSECKAVIFEY